jgi:hypothetical protein
LPYQRDSIAQVLAARAPTTITTDLTRFLSSVQHRGAYGQRTSTGGHFRRSPDWRRSVSGDLPWCCLRRVLYRRWNIDHVFVHRSQRSSSTNSVISTTRMGPPRHRRHTYSSMAGQGAGLLASLGIQRWGRMAD